jgi:hypothetical protein
MVNEDLRSSRTPPRGGRSAEVPARIRGYRVEVAEPPLVDEGQDSRSCYTWSEGRAYKSVVVEDPPSVRKSPSLVVGSSVSTTASFSVEVERATSKMHSAAEDDKEVARRDLLQMKKQLNLLLAGVDVLKRKVANVEASSLCSEKVSREPARTYSPAPQPPTCHFPGASTEDSCGSSIPRPAVDTALGDFSQAQLAGASAEDVGHHELGQHNPACQSSIFADVMQPQLSCVIPLPAVDTSFGDIGTHCQSEPQLAALVEDEQMVFGTPGLAAHSADQDEGLDSSGELESDSLRTFPHALPLEAMSVAMETMMIEAAMRPAEVTRIVEEDDAMYPSSLASLADASAVDLTQRARRVTNEFGCPHVDANAVRHWVHGESADLHLETEGKFAFDVPLRSMVSVERGSLASTPIYMSGSARNLPLVSHHRSHSQDSFEVVSFE